MVTDLSQAEGSSRTRRLQIHFDNLNDLNASALLYRVEGEEAISQPFGYELSFLTSKLDINPRDLVGQGVKFRVGHCYDEQTQTGAFMHRHGLVRSVSMGPILRNRGRRPQRQVTARIEPWFAFLSASRHRRSFEHQSVLEIFSSVVQDYAIFSTAHEIMADAGRFKRYEVRMQYDESDFQFLSRLLADEGIAYYFRHAEFQGEIKHTMVLADKTNQAMDLPGPNPVPFGQNPQARALDLAINHWEYRYDFQPLQWVERDYDFTHQTPDGQVIHTETPIHPDVEPPAFQQGILGKPDRQFSPFSNHEFGRYMIREGEPVGNRFYPRTIHGEMGLGARRMAERESQCMNFLGRGTVCTFGAGAWFTFKPWVGDASENSNELDAENRYLITRLKTEATAVVEGLNVEKRDYYHNEFECHDAVTSFWPTPLSMPTTCGPQTAVVVDEEGKTTEKRGQPVVDEFGRVRVRYHWDLQEKASCWVRVSQAWAGAQHGSMMFPLVGHEVLVDFLDNNPDRPVVVGRIYNGYNHHPLPLDPEARPRNSRQMMIVDPIGNSLRFQGMPAEPQVVLKSVESSEASNPRGSTKTAANFGFIPDSKKMDLPNVHDMGNTLENQTVPHGIYLESEGGASLSVADDLLARVCGSSLCSFEKDLLIHTQGNHYHHVTGSAYSNIVKKSKQYIGEDRSHLKDQVGSDYTHEIHVEGPAFFESKARADFPDIAAFTQQCHGNYDLEVNGKYNVRHQNDVEIFTAGASASVNVAAKAEFNLAATFLAQMGLAAELNWTGALQILFGFAIRSELLSLASTRFSASRSLLSLAATAASITWTDVQIEKCQTKSELKKLSLCSAGLHLIV